MKINNYLQGILIVLLAVIFFLMARSVQSAKDVSLANQKLIEVFLQRQTANRNAIIETQNLILEKCGNVEVK